MKNIYKPVFFLTPVIALLSCSERTDIYSEMNTPPALTVAGAGCPDGTVFRDTIKLGSVWEKGYSLDDETGAGLSASFLAGIAETEITADKVKVAPAEAGDITAGFEAEDGFGAACSFSVELHVFRNMRPEAQAQAFQDPGGYDPLEFYIDASGSYDPDGEITAYRYRVENNYDKTVTDPVLRYIPETGGQKKITVEVRDSDGEWSEPAELYITLK